MYFYRLTGKEPFRGQTIQQTFDLVKRGDLDLQALDGVSEQACDWILKALSQGRKERMNINEALAHAWLNEPTPSNIIDTADHQNLLKNQKWRVS